MSKEYIKFKDDTEKNNHTLTLEIEKIENWKNNELEELRKKNNEKDINLFQDKINQTASSFSQTILKVITKPLLGEIQLQNLYKKNIMTFLEKAYKLKTQPKKKNKKQKNIVTQQSLYNDYISSFSNSLKGATEIQIKNNPAVKKHQDLLESYSAKINAEREMANLQKTIEKINNEIQYQNNYIKS